MKDQKFDLTEHRRQKVRVIPAYCEMAREHYTVLLQQSLKAKQALTKVLTAAECMLFSLDMMQDGLNAKKKLIKNGNLKPKTHGKK